MGYNYLPTPQRGNLFIWRVYGYRVMRHGDPKKNYFIFFQKNPLPRINPLFDPGTVYLIYETGYAKIKVAIFYISVKIIIDNFNSAGLK
jgi:hypothetical protein